MNFTLLHGILVPMPNGFAVQIVEWDINRAAGSGEAIVTGRNRTTGALYQFRVAIEALPALRDSLNSVINAHPELFPRTVTERLT